MKRIISVALLAALLVGCAAMQNPLAGIDIPEPEYQHPFITFIKGVSIVKRGQTEKFEDARQRLEAVIQADERLFYPEAYPYLVACYQELGLVDSADWIYALAQERLSSQTMVYPKLDSTFASWQAQYPELPAHFQEKDFMVMDGAAEPLDDWVGIYRRLEYPEMARSMSRTGTTWLSWIVKADGQVIELQVIKSSYPDLDEAALTTLRNTRFKPAMYRGNPVPYHMIFPIKFSL